MEKTDIMSDVILSKLCEREDVKKMFQKLEWKQLRKKGDTINPAFLTKP